MGTNHLIQKCMCIKLWQLGLLVCLRPFPLGWAGCNIFKCIGCCAHGQIPDLGMLSFLFTLFFVSLPSDTKR